MHELLIYILLFFIGASLVLYVTLGGADYGAGILELLPSGTRRDEQESIITKAMGPVWEANHMWLIIVVVILFMGFPKVFTTMMVSFHIPIVALLLGIVVRGSVFTFRHYDAMIEPVARRVYTLLFSLSSLWTTLWFGVIAGSLYRGRIDLETKDFVLAYVDPWWGVMPLAMGLFAVVIFVFLASVYLIGETRSQEMKRFFRGRAFVANILVVCFGALVFFADAYEGGDLLHRFLSQPLALATMVVATLLFGVLWLLIPRQRSYWARIVAAGQAALILFGWYFVYAPQAMITRSGAIDFFTAAAPEATLLQLALALVIGSLFIFPSLFFLLKVFKSEVQ